MKLAFFVADSDVHTCCTLHLSSSVKCVKCKVYDDMKISYPHRARRSKCKKPWNQLGTQTAHHERTMSTVVNSWAEIISNNNFVITENDVPKQVVDAAKKLEVSLPFNQVAVCYSTPQKNPGNEEQEKEDEETIQEEIEVVYDEVNKVVHALSPISKITPMERRKTRKKIRFHSPSISDVPSTKEQIGVSETNTSSIVNTLGHTLTNLSIFDSAVNGFCTMFLDETIRNEIESSASNTANNTTTVAAKTSIQSSVSGMETHLSEDDIFNIKKDNIDLKGRVLRLEQQIKVLQKNQLSNHQVPINKGALTVIKASQEKYAKVLKQVKSKKYVGTKKMGRRLLGEILATHPSISFNTAAEIISLVRAQFLTEAELVDGNQLTFNDIAMSSPSEAMLRKILDETATDILFLMHYRIFYEDKKEGTCPALFLSCDKATSGGFVKIISWYSHSSKKVEQKILDVDKTYGDSKDCAKAM